MKRTRVPKLVEDLEDLRDPEAAIAENAGKPLIPWEHIKAEDDLEFTPEFEESIRRGLRDLAEGGIARVRRPKINVAPKLAGVFRPSGL